MLSNILKNKSELTDAIENNETITYLNLYSLYVKKDLTVNGPYFVDGWPLRYVLKWFYKINVDLMSFYVNKDFWLDVISKNKIFVIGYEEDSLDTLSEALEKDNIYVDKVMHGFHTDLEIINAIDKSEADVIFLGLGQPRQEIILGNLKTKMPVICCGAFFKQLSKLEYESTGIVRSLGITALSRWWRQPRMLIKRTLLPLFSIKNSLL